jgi:hypothetical protein
MMGYDNKNIIWNSDFVATKNKVRTIYKEHLMKSFFRKQFTFYSKDI